jgi:SPP1 gp7 family putative phage head morphogenesis protein
MIDDTIRAALITLIKSRRQKMSRAQRRRGIKPQRWLYPWATESRYAATIRAWLRPMKDYVHTYLKENQEAILRGDSTGFTADSSGSVSVSRLDAVPGKSFKKMIDSLDGWQGQYVPNDDESKSGSPIYMGLGNIADSVFDFNEGQYEKGAKSVLGVEFPVGEDWWPEAKKYWCDENYKHIWKTLNDYKDNVSALTEQAVTSGWSVKTLAERIHALDTKTTTGKANFIARDQIGKLNGHITQRRMESVGLTMYIWETSGDERVRPSHEMMDGGLCRWSDGTVYSQDGGKTWIPRPSGAVTVHPGFDPQCRCTATSYWDELVGEADAAIESRPTASVPKPGNKTAKSAKQGALAKIGQTENPKASEKTESVINSKLLELQEWGKTNKREQASMMTQDGKEIGSAKGKADMVELSLKMIQALDKQPPNSLVLLHNHPSSTSFSIADFDVMCSYKSIKELRVVGSNGKTYHVSVGNGKRPSPVEMQKYEKEIEVGIKQEIANNMVRRQLPKGENMWSVYISERNKAFAAKYGWEYTEGKLNG